MRLLILGGTRFAGRAVVEAAQAEGIDVTTLNRGLSGRNAGGVRVLTADRTDPAALAGALGDQTWDAVIDTWSGAPKAVADGCAALAGRAGHYCYVSTISVYADPLPPQADEHAPLVDADPDRAEPLTDLADYPAVKRGAELAALRAFGDRALIARPGLILGPYENIGRLPWWLRRIERGGNVLAPGDPATPLQYIDVRDLAGWLVNAARRGLTGAFNLTGKPGHATMGELLDAAVEVIRTDAALVWIPQERVLDAGVSPWTELPIWLPRDPEYDNHNKVDSSAARETGLADRPVRETVAATWAWLQAEGDPPPRPGIGLDPAREQAVLNARDRLCPVRSALAPAPRAGPKLLRTFTLPDRTLLAKLRAHDRAGRPAARPPAAAAGPPVRRLCLEWRKRLPGCGRTGATVNDVEDYRLVVD